MIRKKDRSTFFTTNAGLCFVISASYSLSALSYLDFPYLIAAVSTLIEYIIILQIREMIGCCGFVCQCHKTLMQRSNVLSCDCANAWIGFVDVDADVLIRGAYTDWPGSTHDARVFRNFSLRISMSFKVIILMQIVHILLKIPSYSEDLAPHCTLLQSFIPS